MYILQVAYMKVHVGSVVSRQMILDRWSPRTYEEFSGRGEGNARFLRYSMCLMLCFAHTNSGAGLQHTVCYVLLVL